ncbi:MAG: type II toxin-antitoxin system PemK/MazF family toxin [Oscillospiraceae bacterium]|jgi:mRNA interferase MazF|nr:type II toxin-antitoxin system PemK/MazF family toxin [Oscillospiraceae bacterium]
MIKQGDIIRLNFSPVIGHEQTGYRPAVIVSNDFTMSQTNLAFVCPITSAVKDSPLRVSLDDRTQTRGDVLCAQMRAIDLETRSYSKIEQLPEDLLCEVIDIVAGMIEVW